MRSRARSPTSAGSRARARKPPRPSRPRRRPSSRSKPERVDARQTKPHESSMSLAPRKSAREPHDPNQHVPLAPSNGEGDAAKDGVRLTAKAIEMAKKALAKRGTPQGALRLGVRG